MAIELNGQGYFNKAARKYDKKGTEDLKKLGINVMRFENRMVCEFLTQVLQAIKDNFRK